MNKKSEGNLENVFQKNNTKNYLYKDTKLIVKNNNIV